ncbi:hypothetical protein [Halorussus aquaticus]|uniref:RING-type E3 ubiquitin transferase n=1 Tax=Halorussus aquaticus TaxID=2953748 RepID=A0ABD5Q4J8_9EURY|nr:hypothetical protein [Halorussus aquaticus]
MNLLDFAAFGALVLGCVWLSTMGLSRAFREFRIHNHIRTNEVTSSQTLPTTDPPHEIEGVAREHDETVTTPFTGTECLAYTYEIRRSENSTFHVVDEGGEAVPFVVEDEEGRVLVEAPDADFKLDTDYAEVVGRFSETPDDVREQVMKTPEQNRPDLSAVPSTKPGKLIERRLETGDETYVYGSGTPAAREGLTARLGSDGAPMFLVGDESESTTAMRTLGVGSAYLLGGLFFLVGIWAMVDFSLPSFLHFPLVFTLRSVLLAVFSLGLGAVDLVARILLAYLFVHLIQRVLGGSWIGFVVGASGLGLFAWKFRNHYAIQNFFWRPPVLWPAVHEQYLAPTIAKVLGPSGTVPWVAVGGTFLGVGITVGILFTAYGQYARGRRIQAGSVQNVASVAESDSPDEVRGVVERHEEVLTAPISGTECVAYGLEAAENPADEEPSPRKFSDTHAVAFAVKDESGRLLVDDENPKLYLQQTAKRDFEPDEYVPGTIRTRNASMSDGTEIPGQAPDDGLRIVESCLEPGTNVFARGYRKDVDDDIDSVGRFVQSGGYTLLLSDVDNAKLAAHFVGVARRKAVLALVVLGIVIFGLYTGGYLV